MDQSKPDPIQSLVESVLRLDKEAMSVLDSHADDVSCRRLFSGTRYLGKVDNSDASEQELQEQADAIALCWNAAPILATEITRLRAELAEERRKVEWRPIETAPKDGTEVLLLMRGEVVTAKWGGDFHRAWIHPTRIMFFDGPSHWLPLAALTPSERKS